MKRFILSISFLFAVTLVGCGNRADAQFGGTGGGPLPVNGLWVELIPQAPGDFIAQCFENPGNGTEPDPFWGDGSCSRYGIDDGHCDNASGIITVAVERGTRVDCQIWYGQNQKVVTGNYPNSSVAIPVQIRVQGTSLSVTVNNSNTAYLVSDGSGGTNFSFVADASINPGSSGGGGGGTGTNSVSVRTCTSQFGSGATVRLFGELADSITWGTGNYRTMSYVSGCFEHTFTNVNLGLGGKECTPGVNPGNTCFTFNDTLDGNWGIDHTGIKFGQTFSVRVNSGSWVVLNSNYLVSNGGPSQNLRVEITPSGQVIDPN